MSRLEVMLKQLCLTKDLYLVSLQATMELQPPFLQPLATGLRLLASTRSPQPGTPAEFCFRLEADFIVNTPNGETRSESHSILFPLSHTIVMVTQCAKTVALMDAPLPPLTENPDMRYVALRVQGTNTPWDFFPNAESAKENMGPLNYLPQDDIVVPIQENQLVQPQNRDSPPLMDFMAILDNDAIRQVRALALSTELRHQRRQHIDTYTRKRPEVHLACTYMMYRAYKACLLHFGKPPFADAEIQQCENHLMYFRPQIQGLINETLAASDYVYNLITHDGITALILGTEDGSPKTQALTALRGVTVLDRDSIIAERGLASLYNHKLRSYLKFEDN